MINLTIDDKEISVEEGTTVLEACKQAGINIPTLCYLEKVQAIGACRVCLVEIDGINDLVASCVIPVSNDMVVYTNNRRVREARKVVVELLLSEHEGECQTCDRNEDCELQSIAHDLGIRTLRYEGEKATRHQDESSIGLVRNSEKCISCRRCVTVCTETQTVSALYPQNRGFKTTIGPAFGKNLDTVTCVQCGQCAAVCPVGAISERDHTEEVWAALDDPKKVVVVQTAPAIRAALGECFGMKPGTLVTGKMTTALHRMGFDAVFDTSFSADLTIMEEGTELLTRLKKALVDGEEVALPMFTSCSPGWIQFMEFYYPDMLDNLSTCKSPQQMMGALVKTYYAQKLGRQPEDMFMVSVMPCTAKKFEAARAEMNDSGVQDVDAVLTTRELGRMITQAGIDFASLADTEMDAPLGLGSGAADIFANTGGVMEAALRTAYELVTGRQLPFENLHVTPVVGLEGIKEAEITIEGTLPEWSFLEGVTARIAVAHTLGHARRLVEKIRAGEAEYHFIEVMTCPGGCIGGGGSRVLLRMPYAKPASRPSMPKTKERRCVNRMKTRRFRRFMKNFSVSRWAISPTSCYIQNILKRNGSKRDVDKHPIVGVHFVIGSNMHRRYSRSSRDVAHRSVRGWVCPTNGIMLIEMTDSSETCRMIATVESIDGLDGARMTFDH